MRGKNQTIINLTIFFSGRVAFQFMNDVFVCECPVVDSRNGSGMLLCELSLVWVCV